VEDAATLGALRLWGCDFAQGFHIARPMPAGQFVSWLTERPVLVSPIPSPRSGS
jgi:EAL domain-containing protein (putative c-di-GMP-specific phosphodiesterase class I)